MASTAVHMPRPTVKRAALTWPGDTTRRSHFEDFLREIGADPESTHLCCKGTSPHPHGHAHTHTHKGSTTSLGSKARLSPSRAADKARASTEDTRRRPSETHVRPALTRGRTMPAALATSPTSPALPIPPKSPAISYIDLENHDATPSYGYFSSARDALLTVVGSAPVDERPSRSPTRSFFRDRAPLSSSPDSDSDSSPSPFSTQTRSRVRTRTRDRSPSRTPSIDSLDTASSSEAPATPRTHSVLAHELPSLDDLERASRFSVQSTCVHCHRAGSNFPSCAKCGERWCSRECRLQAAGGAGARAHACHGRAASA